MTLTKKIPEMGNVVNNERPVRKELRTYHVYCLDCDRSFTVGEDFVAGSHMDVHAKLQAEKFANDHAAMHRGHRACLSRSIKHELLYSVRYAPEGGAA